MRYKQICSSESHRRGYLLEIISVTFTLCECAKCNILCVVFKRILIILINLCKNLRKKKKKEQEEQQ